MILPAGARDHYLGAPGEDPVLVPPDTGLVDLVGERPAIVVDVAADADWLAPMRDAARAAGRPDPEALGRVACDGLPTALLELLDERLRSGDLADAATLVPRYVAVPRGIAAATADAADALDAAHGGEGTWSPGFPLTLRVEPMTLADIDEVHAIERASFPMPWPSYAFRQELENNRMAHYLVVRVER